MTIKEKLITCINLLTEKELSTLFKTATLMLEARSESENPDCPHCGHKNVIKYGHKCGKQRFLCKDCTQTFVTTTNTVMSHSHFPKEIWDHECYQDAPREGHFDWVKYLVNLSQGLIVVGKCAALSAVSGPFGSVFLAAAVNAGMKVWFMSAADYESGNVRDTWQSQSQVTLSAVEGGLSGAAGIVLPGVGMIIANASFGVEFGKLDRALEYHELLFTDFGAWLEVVNDPKAELWDIAGSVVPDVVVAGGGAIKRKAGEVIAKATGKGVDMPVARDVIDDIFDDVKGSYTNGNQLETGDFTENPGRTTYSIVPESTGGVTRQLSEKLPSTAGEWKGMSAVWGNADDLRLPVAAGEMPHSWDVPGVGDYVGNPSGVYGIVPGDIDHAITSQLTTDVKPAASSLDVGDIRVDGFGVSEVDTARAVAGGGEGGLDSSNPFYKQGGGSDLDDFMTLHAEKHAYNPDVKSTRNRTQFGENVDVAKLREDTLLHPDNVIYDSEYNTIKYEKEYDFNISTPDTPTGSHRVFINLDPKAGKTNRNSQFPYYRGNK